MITSHQCFYRLLLCDTLMAAIEELLGSIISICMNRVQRLEDVIVTKDNLIAQQTKNITDLKAEIEKLKKNKKD